MTFEQLQKANESIRTTAIQGKDYAEVNQRIKAFRMCYPEGTIYTEMLSCQNGICIFKATVSANGTDLGVGHAYEKEGSSFINKTSYIENCETSAVGRALGMAGFGIDTSVASAEEVQNAMLNQGKKEDPIAKQRVNEVQVAALMSLIEEVKADAASLLTYYDVEKLDELNMGQWKHCMDILTKRKNGKK